MTRKYIVSIDRNEDGDYTWRCNCGDIDECGDTYEGVREARRHHLEYHAMTEFECAGLNPGTHFWSQMVDMAHELAGDARKEFPEHLTKDDISNLYRQAWAILADLEPGVDAMCSECREALNDLLGAQR